MLNHLFGSNKLRSIVAFGIVVAILAGTQTVMNSNAHLVMLMFKEALH
jgi:hypothetical protein